MTARPSSAVQRLQSLLQVVALATLVAATPAVAQNGYAPPAGFDPYAGAGPSMVDPNGLSPSSPVGGAMLPGLNPAIANVWVKYRQADQGLGFQGSYTTVGTMLPIESEGRLGGYWFSQFQGHMSDEGNFFGNAGFGRRIMVSDERYFGASVWYDYDADEYEELGQTYHQIGVTFETSGPFFDLQLNGYFPVGNTGVTTPLTISGPDPDIGFRDNYILRRGVDTALTGFEARGYIDTMLPALQKFAVQPTFSAYVYDSDLVEQTVGGSLGVQLQPTQRTFVSYQVSSDNTFDTNHYVTVGIGLHPIARRQLNAVPMTPVWRNDHIVRFNRPEIALTNPNTGLPYFVRHVDNDGANVAGGTGTVEDPYNTLAQAGPGGSNPDDIIFVRRGALANGTGYDAGIVLQDRQRLLGDGFAHQVTTVELGTIALPGFSLGARPILQNAGGNIVTLANGNEVSSFDMINGQTGILGNNLSNPNSVINNYAFNINNNAIVGMDLDGVTITNTTGNGIVTGNRVDVNGGNGLTFTTPGQLALDFTANAVTDNDFAGIQIDGTGASTIGATFTGNAVTGNGAEGLLVNAAGNLNLSVASGNVFSNNTQEGVLIIDSNGAAQLASVAFLNSTFEDNGQTGITIVSNGLLGVTMLNNEINDNLADGALIDTSGAQNGIGVAATIRDNGFLSNNGNGLSLLNANLSSVYTLSGNATSNNGLGIAGDGLLLNNTGNASITLVDHVASGNLDDGIDLSNTLNGTLIANIDNLVAFANLNDGLVFTHDTNIGTFSNSSLTLIDSTLNNNQDEGVEINALNLVNEAVFISLDNNVISNNNNSALLVTTSGSTLGIFNLSVTDNVMEQNSPIGGAGVIDVLQTGTNGFVMNAVLDNNRMEHNIQIGDLAHILFNIVPDAAGANVRANIAITNNELENRNQADDPGIVVNAFNDAWVRLDITGNTLREFDPGSQWTGGGIVLTMTGTSQADINIDDNLIRSSLAGFAIDVRALNDAQVRVTVTNNQAVEVTPGAAAAYNFLVDNGVGGNAAMAIDFLGNSTDDANGFIFDNQGTSLFHMQIIQEDIVSTQPMPGNTGTAFIPSLPLTQGITQVTFDSYVNDANFDAPILPPGRFITIVP